MILSAAGKSLKGEGEQWNLWAYRSWGAGAWATKEGELSPSGGVLCGWGGASVGLQRSCPSLVPQCCKALVLGIQGGPV